MRHYLGAYSKSRACPRHRSEQPSYVLLPHAACEPLKIRGASHFVVGAHPRGQGEGGGHSRLWSEARTLTPLTGVSYTASPLDLLQRQVPQKLSVSRR